MCIIGKTESTNSSTNTFKFLWCFYSNVLFNLFLALSFSLWQKEEPQNDLRLHNASVIKGLFYCA